jgi:hypothetical protein
VLLTNIQWEGGTGPRSGWGALYEPNLALVSPSHWYRAGFEVDRFDVCSGSTRQYVLTIEAWLPRRVPTSPLPASALA